MHNRSGYKVFMLGVCIKNKVITIEYLGLPIL